MGLLSQKDKKVAETKREKRRAKLQKRQEDWQVKQEAQRKRKGKKIAETLCSSYRKSCLKGDENPQGYHKITDWLPEEYRPHIIEALESMSVGKFSLRCENRYGYKCGWYLTNVE